MSKMSKAIVALGVVAGLGVAALPLSSYAASQDIEQAKVTVEVGGSINLTLSSEDAGWTEDTNTLALGQIMINGDIKAGTIKATVETNDPLGYQLSIRALNNGEMVGDAGVNIPNDVPAKGDAGWGYNLNAGTTYTILPVTDTVIKADGSTTIADGAVEGTKPTDDTSVTFGVSADSSIPEGTYTGTVVFTAAVR